MSPDPFERIGLNRAELNNVEASEYDIRTMHEFSPLSGRYAKYTDTLRGITSEKEWVKRRLRFSFEYLITLSEEFQNYHGSRKKLFDRPFYENETAAMRDIYQYMSDDDFSRFRKIEGKTDQDVVALNLLGLYKLGISRFFDLKLFEKAMHMGRTSSDLDSNTLSLIMHDILDKYYLPKLLATENTFIEKAAEVNEIPEKYGRTFTVIVGQTHEQPAVPTPLKKVFSNIVHQIDEGVSELIQTGPDGKDDRFRLYGKMGGAVGNDEAMMAAYPGHDWRAFYKRFIEGFGLKYQPTTDQDESNMRLLELLDIIGRLNTPFEKWSDDYSSYLSRRVLKKKTKSGERGSSIMPQKINPWRTEGGESADYFADVDLGVFTYLAKQRKQGDLRRSFLKRYIPIPMASIGIALSRMHEDLEKTVPNYEGIEKELREHPETASATMQMILRAEGVPDAYAMMVEKTRGKHVTKKIMNETVGGLVKDGNISRKVANEIRMIFKHERNVGDALEIADHDLAEARRNIGRLEKVYGLDLLE